MSDNEEVIFQPEFLKLAQTGVSPTVRAVEHDKKLRWLIEIDGVPYAGKSDQTGIRYFASLSTATRTINDAGFKNFIFNATPETKRLVSHAEWRARVVSEPFKGRGKIKDFAEKHGFDYEQTRRTIQHNARFTEIRNAVAEVVGVEVSELWPDEAN